VLYRAGVVVPMATHGMSSRDELLLMLAKEALMRINDDLAKDDHTPHRRIWLQGQQRRLLELVREVALAMSEK